MNFLITGDIVINKKYKASSINKEVTNFFMQSDYNIVNLEAPVTSSQSAIDKTGPSLKAHKKSTRDVFKTLQIDVVTLANNHILDYDEQGVEDTLSFCKANKIKTVGAGMNLQEASNPLYLDTKEGKIALVNFTENEWTCAQKDKGGANPMNLIDNYNQIQEAKKQADFVIAIVHGGNEYNSYPSPRMVKQYRFYAESGADAVIGHHTHCISGNETHQGTPILYSLGNFLFTQESKRDVWYSGLIASLHIKKGLPITFKVLPVQQSKENFNLSLHTETEKILKNIEEINAVIQDEKKLEEKWLEFVEKQSPGFIKRITPLGGFDNRYLKAVLYRSGIYKWFLNRKYLKEHLNRIRCEAHHDVTKEVFNKLLKR